MLPERVGVGTDVPTPVTVITGFLGSGKTTLVNRILTEQHGQRIAVIENEYGEINIDSELVVTSEDDIVQLTNGCMCCTVRGDLVQAFGDIAARLGECDHVVIETSGLAEPAPIIETLLSGVDLGGRFALNAIVTLVDARNVGMQLEQFPEALEQIAVADTIVLNKADLVLESHCATVEKRLRVINPVGRLLRSTRADIPIAEVLQARSVEDLPETRFQSSGSGARAHDHSVGSVALELAEEANGPLVYRWLGDTVVLNRDKLFRTKGIVAIRGAANRVVVQGVHGLLEAQEGAPWGETPRSTRIVFIGRGLDRKELESGLRACAGSIAERHKSVTPPRAASVYTEA